MSTISEKLDRLREIQHGSTPPQGEHRLDAAIAPALGTAVIVVVLVALLLTGVFVRKQSVRPGASAAHGPFENAVRDLAAVPQTG